MVKDRLPRFRNGRAERSAQQHEESAMDQPHGGGLLVLPLLLLAVAVISVPLGRLLRLSPIVPYLAAGVVVGPFGLALRRAIFGLGEAQLALTAAVLGGLAFALGLTGWRGAVIGGFSFAMSGPA